MQKIYGGALALLISALSIQSSVSAQVASSVEVPASSFWTQTLETPRVFLGVGYGHRKWTFDNQADVKQDMIYETVGIEHLKNETAYWAVKLTFDNGKADNHWYDHEMDIEANVGYTLAYDQLADFSFTPFVGFGYFHDKSNDYNGPVYKEKHTYIPVGLVASWTATPEFNVALRGQADWMVSRNLTINGSKSTLSKKIDWRVELPMTYSLCGTWDLAVVPFWRHDANADFTLSGTTQQWGAISVFGARIELGFHL